MPTYEYQCDACQHAFEMFQPMSADPIKKCPKCGKNKVRRLIGAGAGLIFKGSGFYITDYRDGGYKEQAKADSAASSTGDAKPSDSKGGDSKSGDSKPAETKAADAKPAASSESTPAPKSEPKPSSDGGSKKKSK
jgi:putative FmdB family regulatory protein